MTHYPIKPSTSLLALLKAGYRVYSPDSRFMLLAGKDNAYLWLTEEGKNTFYPISTAGLTQAIERMNLPF